MTGQAHVLAFLPLVLIAAVLALVAWREHRHGRGVLHDTRSFRCPILRKRVVATLARDGNTDEVTGVVRCSAFQDPETVVCPKECVELFNRSVKRAAPATKPATTT